MAVLARRIAASAAVVLVTAAAAVALPGAAAAAPAAERTFTVSGDPGEHLTGGLTHDYSAADGDAIYAALGDPGHISVRVDAVNGDDWRLELAAPAGQALGPGTYTGATKWPFNADGVPGLDVGGLGHGCLGIRGAFTVDTLVVEEGRVVELEAGFELRCDGAAEVARGQVHVSGPRVGPLELAVDTTGGTVDETGNAIVDGTVSCTEAVLVKVRGSLLQPAAGPAYGRFDTYVDCAPGGPVPWDAGVPFVREEPFLPGQPASASAVASAVDPGAGARVEARHAATITLTG